MCACSGGGGDVDASWIGRAAHRRQLLATIAAFCEAACSGLWVVVGHCVCDPTLRELAARIPPSLGRLTCYTDDVAMAARRASRVLAYFAAREADFIGAGSPASRAGITRSMRVAGRNHAGTALARQCTQTRGG